MKVRADCPSALEISRTGMPIELTRLANRTRLPDAASERRAPASSQRFIIQRQGRPHNHRRGPQSGSAGGRFWPPFDRAALRLWNQNGSRARQAAKAATMPRAKPPMY